MKLNHTYQGDSLEVLKTFPDEAVNCVVTSPPYWGLRDYGVDGQLGLEKTPEEYVEKMVTLFREIRRVLRKDGTLWLNLGDSYNAGRNGGHSGGQKQASLDRHKGIDKSGANVDGLKPKDLVGIPWRVAFALQADGWYLRQDIIWHKPNPMPESVTDRCTKSHEYIFLLSKSAKYFYDADAIKEKAVGERWGGNKPMNVNNSKDRENIHNGLTRERNMEFETRNKRSVWTINTQTYKEAHFAVFPPKIPELCIKAGSKEGDVILDPFFGSGTTGWVAQRLGRQWIGIELNEDYIELASKRFKQTDMFV